MTINTGGALSHHGEQLINIVKFWGAKRGVDFKIIYGTTTYPDHNNKRCVDFSTAHAVWSKTGKTLSTQEGLDLGADLASFLSENARAFKINGLIWNRRVKGFPHVEQPAYRGPYGTWRTYTGESDHRDHVHVEVDGTGIAASLVDQLTGVKPWAGPMITNRDNVPVFNSNGKIIKRVPKGTRVRGTVDRTKFTDGRYLRIGSIPHRTWIALSDLDHV